MSMGSLACCSVSKQLLAKAIQTLDSKFMRLGISWKYGVLYNIEVRATFNDDIKAKKFEDGNSNELKKNMVSAKAQEATLYGGGRLIFKGRICSLE